MCFLLEIMRSLLEFYTGETPLVLRAQKNDGFMRFPSVSEWTAACGRTLAKAKHA